MRDSSHLHVGRISSDYEGKKHMKVFTRAVVLFAAAAIGIGLAGCTPAEDKPTNVLKIATVGISQDASLAIGNQQGFYKAHGIQVDKNVVANVPASIAAVQSGQLDIAYTPTTSFFMAKSQGVPLQIIASSDGYPAGASQSATPFRMDNTGLFVSPKSGIKSVEQLAGRTIAVPARKAQLEMTIASVVKNAGGDPKSIKWVVLDFSSAVEALKSGTVDAAGLVTPFTTKAEVAGMVQLAAPALEFFGGPSTTGVWVSSPSTIKSKREAIDAFIAAQQEANKYADAHITEAMTIAKDLTGIDLPVADITPVYWVSKIDPKEVRAQAVRIRELGYLDQPLNLDDAFYSSP